MDKLFNLGSVVVAALTLVCSIAFAIIQIAAGHITSIAGYIIIGVFIGLSFALFRAALKDFRNDK